MLLPVAMFVFNLKRAKNSIWRFWLCMLYNRKIFKILIMLLGRFKLKTNIINGISMRNYPSLYLFPADIVSIGRNQGSQKNPYSSWTERDREVGLAYIERAHFFLSTSYLKTKSWMQKCLQNVFVRNVYKEFTWLVNCWTNQI